jgi:hypothetical protein
LEADALLVERRPDPAEVTFAAIVSACRDDHDVAKPP